MLNVPRILSDARFSCTRGWAGELITPAGIPGPESSGAEAVSLLRGEGRRGGRGGVRDHLVETGVGACLNWNPPGSR